MSIRQRDYVLRLIEQAAEALRRLRERLASQTAMPAEVAHEVQQAQRELLGEHATLLRALDASSAATMIRDPDRLALWIELLRLEADAHTAAGDAPRAAACAGRAAALASARAALP